MQSMLWLMHENIRPDVMPCLCCSCCSSQPICPERLWHMLWMLVMREIVGSLLICHEGHRSRVGLRHVTLLWWHVHMLLLWCILLVGLVPTLNCICTSTGHCSKLPKTLKPIKTHPSNSMRGLIRRASKTKWSLRSVCMRIEMMPLLWHICLLTLQFIGLQRRLLLLLNLAIERLS